MNNTTKVITATELKINLGKSLDYVDEDNEVIITKNGKKVGTIDSLYFRNRTLFYGEGKILGLSLWR